MAATLVTMGLCGLWHGAGTTFVVWGLLHGVGLIVNHAWDRSGLAMPPPVAWFVTMLFVLAGWVLFRSPDFATASAMFQSLAGAGAGLEPIIRIKWPVFLAAMVISTIGPTSRDFVCTALVPRAAYAAAFAVIAVVCILEVGKGQPVNFIYFQF